MKFKKKVGEHISDFLIYGVLFILFLVTLYPVYYVLIMSVSDAYSVMAMDVWLFPKGFNLDAYKAVFERSNVWRAYYNTIWYATVGTIISLFVTMTCAYALSRKNFFARRFYMVLITITMFFSGGMIPTFIVVNNLGLYNSRWAIVLPVAMNAWYVIMSRVYFQSSIPDSLPESAKIDGCGDIKILWRIIVPLSKPIVAVIALFTAVGHWNSFFSALIYLRSEELNPITILLMDILVKGKMLLEGGYVTVDKNTIYESFKLKYALIVVTIVPIMIVYPFLQKYFAQGVMIGAIKE